MIIRSITLENFRQYKGKSTIEFSTDKEKNVTVIVGQNTCGKTTLVRAFIWCLYGKISFDNPNLLNDELAQELLRLGIGASKKVAVEIDLVHKGKRSLIRRQQIKEIKDNGKVNTIDTFQIYDYEDGGWRPSGCKTFEQLNDRVQEIMPFNLSNYFFFWGERIETLTEKKEISEAVKDFLGLTILDKVEKHLKSAIQQLETSLAMKNQNDTAINIIKTKLDDLHRQLDTYQSELKEAEKEKVFYEEEFKKLEQEILNDSNQEIVKNQEKLKFSLLQIEKEKERLKSCSKDFIRKFNSNAVNFYASAYSEKAIRDLSENFENTDEGWIHVNSKTIDEILKKGRCLCDTKILEGSENYNKLISLKKYVSPNYIVPMVESFKTECRVRKQHAKNYYTDLVEIYKNIEDSRNSIIDFDDKIKELKKATEGISNVEEKRSKMERYQNKFNEKNQLLGGLKANIEHVEKNIENHKEKLHQLIEKKGKQDVILLSIKYAEKVRENIIDEYKSKEKEIRSNLQNYVSMYFNEMYTGNREVTIDDKFKIQAYNYVNGVKMQSEGSPGLETVKNFAFIAGLVQLAKDIVATGSKEELLESEPYPLVLDAPFSQADDDHVPAISSLITKVAEQTILVVMQKDWNYAKNDMKNFVGKYYRLNKKSETCTEIETKEDL